MSTSDFRIPPLGKEGVPGQWQVQRFRISPVANADDPDLIDLGSTTGVKPLFQIKASLAEPVLISEIIVEKTVPDTSTGGAAITIGPTAGTGWLTDTVLKLDTSGTIQADINTVHIADAEVGAGITTAALDDGVMELWVVYTLGRK